MNSIPDTRKANEQPDPSGSANPMLQVVLQDLSDLGWTHDVREEDERTVVTTRVSQNHGAVRAVFDINVSRDRFGIFVYAPLHIPEANRSDVMVYLTRANYRVYLSKFEFDLRDGELRVVSSVIPAGSTLSVQMVARMRRDALRVMDVYMPGVLAIVYGHRTADEAWEALNAEQTDESDVTTAAEAETASSGQAMVE